MCRSFKVFQPILHVLAVTLRAFHDVNLLDYLLTSVHVIDVFIHISGFFFTLSTRSVG